MAAAIGILPLSPALSDCDSLVDIDDLDAFLAAQGPLSAFPTPPVKSLREVLSTVSITLVDEYQTETEDEEFSHFSSRHSQFTFAIVQETRQIAAPESDDIFLIEQLLNRLDVPVEILAIAYSILRKLNTQHPSASLKLRCPELILTSALALANIYASDMPPHSATWARQIARRGVSAADVDSVNLATLDALGWSIHSLCSPDAIDASLDMLYSYCKPDDRVATTSLVPTLLKLDLSSTTSACWANGQLTPEGSPPCIPVKDPFLLDFSAV